MAKVRMDDKIKTLSTVRLFSGCSKKELQSVARLCTPLSGGRRGPCSPRRALRAESVS